MSEETTIDTAELGEKIVKVLKTIYDPEIPVDIYELGFDFGLRSNKQEALNYQVNTLGNTTATFDNIDNELQTFWTLGLSYAF